MSTTFFHLQVDRLDEPAVCIYYFRLGTNAERLAERVEKRLAIYRRQGFVIVQYDNRPYYWTASRRDGVKLEIMLVERPFKMPGFIMNFELIRDEGDDDAATAN